MPERPYRLYHFSENASIEQFEPHVALSSSMAEPAVWALDPAKAYLYLFPRDCPRVTFFGTESTSKDDLTTFFAHTDARRIVAIESGWLERLRTTALYRYEFEGSGFELLDATAGYWVRKTAAKPVSMAPVGDLLNALIAEGAELRITPSLWPLYEAVVASTLGYSIIRFRNAAARHV